MAGFHGDNTGSNPVGDAKWEEHGQNYSLSNPLGPARPTTSTAGNSS